MCFDLLEPVLDVVKGGLLGAVVDEDDTHGALVVGLRDCPKSFLACGVPDLEFDSLVLDRDGFDLEVDAYSVVLREE